MDSSTRKIVFPLILAFVASLVVTAVVLGPGRPAPEPTEPQTAATEPVDATPAAPAVTPADDSGATASTETSDPTTPVAPVAAEIVQELNLPQLPDREEGWGALLAEPSQDSLADRGEVSSLGSLDPNNQRILVEFASQSAGISRIVFSDFWRTGQAKREAQAHFNAVNAGAADPPALPDGDQRYVLQTSSSLKSTSSNVQLETPILAAHSLLVTGWGESPVEVVLFNDVWSETAPGVFESKVMEESTGAHVLTVKRRYDLIPGRYEIALTQSVTNHSELPLRIQWRQFGPGDLARDETTYLTDMRRFHFGYLMNKERDPSQSHVLYAGMMIERKTAIDMAETYSEDPLANTLWPTEMAREDGFNLSWFGATNRYFTLSIHAPYDPPEDPSKRLGSVETINPVIGGGGSEAEDVNLLTSLIGTTEYVGPSETANWDMGVYAGPLERAVLDNEEPYSGLNMGGLILYLMSGCCSFCTFAWLADFMIIFLSFINGLVFDWGISIIFLVIVVRTLLHPITRKGQISMQRNAKAMGELKPELDELKKRYGNDADKMRKEQMRLMQEKGMNPLGCGGAMLPMFLQMPIWIALYAVLFFAFELRQEWAFYGIFQMFDGWSFMGDLSAPDHFIKFGTSFDLYLFKLSGVNLLPILMGLVFYFQQKYMTPPPSASMSEDQLRQQKMMKIMMLVLFPVMLYGAPSGLTLYILTSSIIGTLESRYIRGHIKRLQDREENDPEYIDAKARAVAKKAAKQDRMGKMYEQMMENARQRQEMKKQKKKTFKKR